MKKTGRAFAPGAISSFFAVHDKTSDEKPIADLEKVGAWGGGFGLQKGVNTKVTVERAEANSTKIIINNKQTQAKTTQTVVDAILSKLDAKFQVTVEHQIEVPVGSGFGTSAGGALTAGLALKQALNLPLTYNQIGKIAHIAEIQNQTGLGTVSALTFGGGCILVTKPGAPGLCQIDRIPISSDYNIVIGYVESSIPKTVLSDPQRKLRINRWGKKTLQAILEEPSLENFLDCCWDFAQKAGFATENVCRLVELAKKAGAVGAAQNMIGEAVHAVVLEENTARVEEAFKQALPEQQVIVSKLDFEGVRLV